LNNSIYHQVNINGKDDFPVVSVDLRQSIFGHHSFTVKIKDKHNLKSVKQFEDALGTIGGNVLFTFESPFYTDKKSEFKGIVTQVGVTESTGADCTISISGYSPSILLDNLANSAIYLKKSLQDVFRDLLASQPSNILANKNNSQKAGKADFIFQFNESNYNFLARHAQYSGEWLFYDGETLHLGLPSNTKKHKLTIGKDITNLKLQMFTAPLKQKVSGYTYKEDKSIVKDLNSLIQAKDYLDEAKNKSNKFFTTEGLAPAMVSSESRDYPEDYAKNKANVLEAGLMTVRAYSNYPGLHLGDSIEILTEDDTYGKFVVVELNHELDLSGYRNEFVAIPESVKSPPENPTIIYPSISSMTAKVTDNKDPDKLGRIKVQFTWTNDKLETDWIRVVHSAAGPGYGNYFTPEVGDQVNVEFEFGNPDMPYASGSLYHNKNKPDNSFNDNNYLKVIRTKGGNQIVINDEGGKESIEISPKDAKHKIFIDNSSKKIEITSFGDITITAADNITLDAKKKIDIKCDELVIKANKSASIESVEVKVKGTSSVALEATGQFGIKGATTKVEGQGSLELKASGITQVNGSLVKIN
jgi:type VI secretion system secreted protein VgrG